MTKIEKYSDLDDKLKNQNFISFIFEGKLYWEKELFWIEIENMTNDKFKTVKWTVWKTMLYFTNNKSGWINKWNSYKQISWKSKKEIKELTKELLDELGFKSKDYKKIEDLTNNDFSIWNSEVNLEEKILSEAFNQIFKDFNKEWTNYKFESSDKATVMKIDFPDNQSKWLFESFVKKVNWEIIVRKSKVFQAYYIVTSEISYKSHTGRNSLDWEVLIFEKGIWNEIEFVWTRKQMELRHWEEIR